MESRSLKSVKLMSLMSFCLQLTRAETKLEICGKKIDKLQAYTTTLSNGDLMRIVKVGLCLLDLGNWMAVWMSNIN